jgi:hypothetical protein
MYVVTKITPLVVVPLVLFLMTFSVSAYAIIGLPGTTDNDNTIQQSQSESESESPPIPEATENVITYNTSVADIPGIAGGSDDLIVGAILYGCDDIVSRGNTVSVDAKPGCDIVIRYIVNYCLSHMKDAMAIENKQICWDNAMDLGLKYAVKWLDGGTGVMLKARSDIMAIKANVIGTLSKETLISQCEANQGFKFSPSTADLMMKLPIETLRKTCG